MIHVLARLDGDDIYVLKVADTADGYALVDNGRYLRLGRVTRTESVRDGFTVHEWFAIGDGDLFQVRAGTRKKAVQLLLERYGMHQVRDLDTIPALF